MKGSLPADRHAALVAEMKKNEPRFVRHSSTACSSPRTGFALLRLCDSGAMAWVVFGERDDVGLTDQEGAGSRNALV